MSTRIAGASLNQIPLDWKHNLGNIRKAIANAKAKKVAILCLPELCITGYGCEDMFLSPWIYKKSITCLLDIATWCEGLTVAVGLPVQHHGKYYNTTCIIQNKEIIGFYAKQNLARDGVHYEPRWFSPWPKNKAGKIKIDDNTYPFGDITTTHGHIKIGFEICEDAWHEDRPACQMKNMELILNPSASHFSFGKTLLREELVVDSSKKFNCTYLYANLLGNEAGRMIYDGEILIARYGNLIKRDDWLSFEETRLVYADIDFNNKKETYPSPTKYIRDKNTEFSKATSLALFDYMRKSRSKGFVLSLSGGADSSCLAVMVAEMVKRGVKELGVNHFIEKLNIDISLPAGLSHNANCKYIIEKLLTCAYQASENSSAKTFTSAKTLADDIGASFHHWSIAEEVYSYSTKAIKALGRKLDWKTDDIAMQNIQARARSPLIWMVANIKGAILLTTSNRSEGAVGYTTMDGDTSGSLAPIAAVDKPFILQWLKWAEEHLDYDGLKEVNQLKPTAELRPGTADQVDELDLMPYDILVAIEKLAIRDRLSPIEVYEVLEEEQPEKEHDLKQYIIKFFTLWAQNQWKRERIAPAFQLDDFNIDPKSWYRFPILSSGFKEELEALKKS